MGRVNIYVPVMKEDSFSVKYPNGYSVSSVLYLDKCHPRSEVLWTGWKFLVKILRIFTKNRVKT